MGEGDLWAAGCWWPLGGGRTGLQHCQERLSAGCWHNGIPAAGGSSLSTPCPLPSLCGCSLQWQDPAALDSGGLQIDGAGHQQFLRTWCAAGGVQDSWLLRALVCQASDTRRRGPSMRHVAWRCVTLPCTSSTHGRAQLARSCPSPAPQSTRTPSPSQPAASAAC